MRACLNTHTHTAIIGEEASLSDQRLNSFIYTEPAFQDMVIGWDVNDYKLAEVCVCVPVALNQHTHAHRGHTTLHHMTVAYQETPLCQRAGSSRSMRRLLRLNRGAFERAGADSTQHSSVPPGGGCGDKIMRF